MLELKVQISAAKGTDSYIPLIHSLPATPDQHHQLWLQKLLQRFCDQLVAALQSLQMLPCTVRRQAIDILARCASCLMQGVRWQNDWPNFMLGVLMQLWGLSRCTPAAGTLEAADAIPNKYTKTFRGGDQTDLCYAAGLANLSYKVALDITGTDHCSLQCSPTLDHARWCLHQVQPSMQLSCRDM